MASETPKKITVKTSDHELFDLDEPVALEFNTIKSFFEEDTETALHTNIVVPLPNVSSAALPNIITYCKKHLEFRDNKSTTEDEVTAFDDNFVKAMDNDEIVEMTLAANYLDIKELLELLQQTVADRVKNKSVEYVRKFFGIENDYTPEEEANLREENEWAFEGVEN